MNETRPTQIPNRTVVLIGMMGAGKSSIGRRLARRLGMTFVDADQEIESAAGCTIPDIFKLYGEAAFREGERKVIGRLLAGPPIILATGGGAFMDDVARAQIKSQGISVWLRAELDILLERVSRRDDRPLLKQGDPKEILTKLIAERYPVYGLADIIVDSGDGPHELVVEAIVDRLAAYDAETPRSQKIEAAR
jgi:shikimate kinase